MKDLEFIAGDFLDCEIPKNMKYLQKYFEGDIQLAFLRYYLVFGDCENFNEHTGYRCSRSFRTKLKLRFNRLTTLYDKSKKSFTEEGLKMIQLIESGKFNLTRLSKS